MKLGPEFAVILAPVQEKLNRVAEVWNDRGYKWRFPRVWINSQYSVDQESYADSDCERELRDGHAKPIVLRHCDFSIFFFDDFDLPYVGGKEADMGETGTLVGENQLR